jgi:radical SAM protein with 4Fe4S-binding SPASM domain
MQTKFGNAKETSLEKVLTDPTFTAPWSADKSQIDTCKVCEFRFICTDCRAFTENNHPLGKPRKCGYDPYSGNWE